MKKIFFVVHSYDSSFSGGVLRVTSELLNNICMKNHKYKFSLISIGKVHDHSFPLKDDIGFIELGLKHHSTQFYKGIGKILWFIKNFIIFYKVLKKNPNSTWVITSPPLCMLFGVLKIFFRKENIIGWDHTSTVYKSSGIISKFKLFLYSLLDKFVALTPEDKAYYINNNVKSVYIPNGICFNEIKLISNKKKYLIFVSRFSEEKRPLLALQVYLNSKLWEKNIFFKIYGSGELISNLEKFILENNLSEYVDIITNETNLDIIYKDAYALILTSKVEGFGMVLLEAIARNIPAIAFDVKYGPRNIISHNINGFLVKDNDIVNFVNKIKLIDELETSISYTVKKYDFYNVLQKWLNII